MNRVFNPLDLAYQVPLLILVVGSLLLVLAEAFSRVTTGRAPGEGEGEGGEGEGEGGGRGHLMGFAVAFLIAAAIAAIYQFKTMGASESRPLFGGMLVADRFGCTMIALVSTIAALTAMITPRHQTVHDWEQGEYYGVLLLAVSGMAMMAMAGDLVTVFIGIETMSLGVYVLTAARRRSLRSTEAAMKYFLMGAFATGFLLYGIALIYGAAGTTNLAGIEARRVALQSSPLLIGGIFFMVVAFGFKIAAVPFHMWAPDAYEGAPTPVTGFMAAAVKASAFAVMLRLFADTLGGEVLPFGPLGWTSPLIVMAVLTMILGNIAALRQENIKRMLAYSSIAHAGVILVGVIAVGMGGTKAGLSASAQTSVLYYLIAYSVTTLGAFSVIVWIGGRGRERVLVSDWNGLASKHPAAALAMTICMLSLGGIPPTAGFLGKFYVFKSTAEVYVELGNPQLLWLVVIGVLSSAMSIFYYLRVVTAMYFREPDGEFAPLRSGALAFAIVVCALAILEMGILPGLWLTAAGG